LDAAAIDDALAYLALSARYGTLVPIGPLTGSAPSAGMLGVVPLPSAPPDQLGIVVHAGARQEGGHAMPALVRFLDQGAGRGKFSLGLTTPVPSFPPHAHWCLTPRPDRSRYPGALSPHHIPP
jgi:hypothetical protein